MASFLQSFDILPPLALVGLVVVFCQRGRFFALADSIGASFYRAVKPLKEEAASRD